MVTVVLLVLVLLVLLALVGRIATPVGRRERLRALTAADLAECVAEGLHALLTVPPRTPR